MTKQRRAPSAKSRRTSKKRSVSGSPRRWQVFPTPSRSAATRGKTDRSRTGTPNVAAVTDRPDAERDTAAWDDFDSPDSTADWMTNASLPPRPAPQRAPSRQGDDARQPSAKQTPWEPDPSRNLFSDRSSPSAAA